MQEKIKEIWRKFSSTQGVEPNLVTDLVCQMKLSLTTAKFSSEYKNKTYYFCSRFCEERFEANPEKYIAP